MHATNDVDTLDESSSLLDLQMTQGSTVPDDETLRQLDMTIVVP